MRDEVLRRLAEQSLSGQMGLELLRASAVEGVTVFELIRARLLVRAAVAPGFVRVGLRNVVGTQRHANDK